MSAHEGSAAQVKWEENERAAKAAELVRQLAAEPAEKSDELNDELQVMRSVARALEKLPADAQWRLLNWLFSRTQPRIGAILGPLAVVYPGQAR